VCFLLYSCRSLGIWDVYEPPEIPRNCIGETASWRFLSLPCLLYRINIFLFFLKKKKNGLRQKVLLFMLHLFSFALIRSLCVFFTAMVVESCYA
jgi:hypothetical protein